MELVCHLSIEGRHKSASKWSEISWKNSHYFRSSSTKWSVWDAVPLENINDIDVMKNNTCVIQYWEYNKQNIHG